jgi:hypothetical protein
LESLEGIRTIFETTAVEIEDITASKGKIMKNWLDYLMAQARRYTVIDFTFFKLVLISLGILLGSYFAAFFQSIIVLIWIIFVVSYVAVLKATFRKSTASDFEEQ